MSAAPQIKLEIDRKSLANFQAALSLYAKATGKDAPEIVNRAAVNLAFRAAEFTPKADMSAAIGKIRNIYAFTNFRYTQTRRKHPKRAKMDAAVLRTIRQLNALSGFIRRGWVAAGRKLKAQSGVTGTSRAPAGGGGKKGKGTATMAREAVVSFAEIVNYSTSKSGSSPAALEKYGGSGLSRAVSFVANDMRQYAEKKLAQRAKENFK